MKKVFVLGIVLAISAVSFLVEAQTAKGGKTGNCGSNQGRLATGSEGCGGGERVCCANTTLNFG